VSAKCASKAGICCELALGCSDTESANGMRTALDRFRRCRFPLSTCSLLVALLHFSCALTEENVMEVRRQSAQGGGADAGCSGRASRSGGRQLRGDGTWSHGRSTEGLACAELMQQRAHQWELEWVGRREEKGEEREWKSEKNKK
jgi:hypothetical protein